MENFDIVIDNDVLIFIILVISCYLVYKLNSKHHILQDLKTIKKLIQFGFAAKKKFSNGMTTADVWESTVKARPNQPAIVFIEDNEVTIRTFTFKELDEYANRVANFLTSQGLRQHDNIGLFMENRPEFVGIWLGIQKIGGSVTLINTAIKEKSLLHCLTIVSLKAIFYGKELEPAMRAVQSQLDPSIHCWVQGMTNSKDSNSLDLLLHDCSNATPSRSMRSEITP
jgi:solute carrier family 27 fatty acid transporter 1/4